MPAGAAVEVHGDLRPTIAAVDSWLRAHDFAGYDPYDSLNARRLPAFCRSTARRRQIVVQVGKRSPVNVRPALGVPRQKIGKALALIASGYAQLQRLQEEPGARSIALSLLSQLEAKRLSTGDKACWGYEFDVQTRWASLPRGTPNIIATTFVAHAFLDWYELDRDPSKLAVASAAVRYLNDDLVNVDEAESFYAYVPGSSTLIHNANVLGCALASRVARLTGETGLADSGPARSNRDAVRSTSRRAVALRPWVRP